MRTFSFLPLLLVIFNLSCSAQSPTGKEGAAIIFYNVENLYDTINDIQKDDEEFLPGSDHQWTAQRYQIKLEHTAQVITTAGPSVPVLVGLSEIENARVLKDLIAISAMKSAQFDYIQFDSPDERGIDVALLYNKNVFTPKKSEPIHVDLPGEPVDFTRDILFVNGVLLVNGKKQEINIFVNHWPSRSEGEEISMPKRAAAAQQLKKSVDALLSKDKNAAIIIMGDFNDTPFDKSIQVELGAKEFNTACSDGCLIDLMSVKQQNGEGSYNYKGNWQCLDQFIVSQNLLDGNALDVNSATVQYLQQPWMLYHSEKYGDSPNRTYAGPKYIGGYSDHLPAYMELMGH